jgi:outer membrane protein insertion porin family
MAQFGRTGAPTPTRTTSNDELSYLNPKDFVIGGTKILGTEFLDNDVLITISKLTKGDRITVPGDATSNAVKNLWAQGLFDDVKLKTYKLYLTNNCINIKQIKLVLNEITFEENKLKAAKMSYIKTTDKNEYFLLNDSFKFTTTINELNDYILNKKYLTNEE